VGSTQEKKEKEKENFILLIGALYITLPKKTVFNSKLEMKLSLLSCVRILLTSMRHHRKIFSFVNTFLPLGSQRVVGNFLVQNYDLLAKKEAQSSTKALPGNL